MINKYRDIINFKLLVSLALAIILGLLIIYLSNIQSFLDSYYFLKYAIFFSLAIFCIYKIQQNYSFYLPSFYLFLFFSIVPLFGIKSYQIYSKLYPDYLGVQLDMKQPLDFWLQGTFFIMFGIYLTHFFKNFTENIKKNAKCKTINYTSWNWNRLNIILFIICCISFIFTVYVVVNIGYIPILKGNIAIERFSYRSTVGDWPMKLARLWLLVYLLSFIKLIYNIKSNKKIFIRKNLLLIILLFLSAGLDGIYGDRFHHFVMFFFSIIIINKVLKKIRLFHFVIFILIAILMANVVSNIRNKGLRHIEISFLDKVLFQTFSEYQSFAYLIQEYPMTYFAHGKAFLGTLAPVFPKQIWKAFNVNKDDMYHKNSASEMSRIYGHYAGIRVGILGEGFLNFGYFGIIITSFFVGILFGILENIYVNSQNLSLKEFIITFSLSILMFLPLAQTNVLMSMFVYYMYFILICIFFSNKKVDVGQLGI